MTTGYFQHCTFFAVYRDNQGGLYSRVQFVQDPQPDPRYFFSWAMANLAELKTQTAGPVAMIDCKVIEAPEHQYFDFSNQ